MGNFLRIQVVQWDYLNPAFGSRTGLFLEVVSPMRWDYHAICRALSSLSIGRVKIKGWFRTLISNIEKVIDLLSKIHWHWEVSSYILCGLSDKVSMTALWWLRNAINICIITAAATANSLDSHSSSAKRFHIKTTFTERVRVVNIQLLIYVHVPTRVRIDTL